MLKLLESKTIDNFEKGPIRRSLFNNGAVSIYHHARNFSGARVQLHFLAGSMFESKEEHGLSHLIEHMAFKDGGSGVVKELELMGAGLNAYTYKENVCFEMSCNSKKLSSMLPKFLAQFLTLEFNESELAKEKKVIMQELRDDMDDHETQAVEYAFAKNFPEDIGHPIGGNIGQVAKYQSKDVNRFHKKFYKPSRMILVVVSGKKDLDLETIFKNEMDKAYAFKLAKPFRLKATAKDGQLTHFKSKLKRKLENGIFVLSFDGPSLNSPNFYDFIVLDELLFEGMNAIYFKELREKTPLVYGYGSSINGFAKSGNYLMIFNTQKKKLPELKDKCLEVLEKYSKKLIDQRELELVKNRVLDSWELSFDDLEERVEFISGTEIYQLDEFSVNNIKKKIEKITPQSIQKLLSRLLRNNYSQLMIEPK